MWGAGGCFLFAPGAITTFPAPPPPWLSSAATLRGLLLYIKYIIDHKAALHNRHATFRIRIFVNVFFSNHALLKLCYCYTIGEVQTRFC